MDLEEAARCYLGVPWVHQGRTRAGMDCVGLPVVSLADSGYVVRDITTYGRNPHRGQLERHLQAAFGPPVPKAEMAANDIVAIAFKVAIRHVGIIARYRDGGLSLIHTDQMVGRVTEHRIDAAWLDRIKAVYRPNYGEAA